MFYIFCHSPAIQDNRVTTVQCLSGTGSLRVGGEFLAKHYHQVKCFVLDIFLLLCITTLNFFSPISRELLLALISLQGESSTFCPSSFPIAKVFNASISPYVQYRLQIWRHFQFFEVIFIDCKLQWPWIKVFWSQVWRVTVYKKWENLKKTIMCLTLHYFK